MIWAIWDAEKADWVRETPAKPPKGTKAILAFESKREATHRAAKEFKITSFDVTRQNQRCEVRRLR